MAKHIARRATLPVSLAVLLVTAAGTVASAYWSGDGTGAGAAATQAVSEAVTLSPGTPAASLFPGSQGDVVLSLSNPNSAAIHITELLLDTTEGELGFAVDGPHADAGCSPGNYTFTTQDNDGDGWTVPAKMGTADGSIDVTLTAAVEMGETASNACQGATLTVYLAAGP